jgi:hypothetical protein
MRVRALAGSLALALVVCGFTSSIAAASVAPRPESVLGWKPCADYKLSTYEQITRYFCALDAASDRMRIVNVGKTSEGRDQIMAIVSDPQNLANLSTYQRISQQLSQGSVSDKAARQLAINGKTIAWIDFGIHSTEVAPTQTAPQFAYDLVTSETDEARSIRRNVVTLFVPNVNPDGTTKISDWYMQHVGTPYRDSTYPELYQKYAGHDDNRDWFMFNLAETRNLGKVLFHDWTPQLVYNTHQEAAFPARIFVPPFKDPSNPNIPPEIIRDINSIGDAMTQRLDREGKVGAVSRQQYDQWWNGGLRSAPAFHNQVGILTETSHASATPKYYDPAAFPKTFPYQGVSTSEPSAFYPSPWKGGWWHQADSCAYIESTAWSYLHQADVDRFEWLYGSYRMAKRAIVAGGDESYVIPADQSDLATATKMVNVLRQNNIRVERSLSPFEAGGKTYPAGSFVVRAAQPYRAAVVDLLNPQVYPDRRNPDGTPERPYDMAGWTLQYQMGVQVDKISAPFNVNSRTVSVAPVPPAVVPSGLPKYAYAVDTRQNDSFAALNRLMARGVAVTRTTSPVSTSLGSWPAGTFLVRDPQVLAEAKRYGLTIAAVDAEPSGAVAVKAPRVGLYHGWGGNADEGWTRYVLENFSFGYQQVHDADVRAGGLSAKYDVIVLPDATYARMRDGLKAGTIPPEYAGGMTAAGVENLRKFAADGGTIVTVDGASELPIKGFGLPVTDVTSGLPSTKYYSPGSVVANQVETDPVTYGLPANLDAYSDHSPAFVANASGISTPVRYPEAGILRSGWLLGADVVAGRSSVVNAPFGKGRVVLLGLSVQHRAQAHGTFKLLFNSLYLSSQ